MARYRRKGRTRPIKSTATYKKGEKRAWIVGGVVVAITLALFPAMYNEIFKRTPTIGG